MVSYHGDLVGGKWSQYSNSAGQVYYIEIVSRDSRYDIPPGWEDQPQDHWNYDATYKHWANVRTGRVVFQDPKPPPAQTYLDEKNVIAHLEAAEKYINTEECAWRRAISAILRWLFKEDEGYDVVQQDGRGGNVPSHAVLKIECKEGESFQANEFMIVECKKAGISWQEAFDSCVRHCQNSQNQSGQVYGMVQVGINIQFHQWGNSTSRPLTGVFHLRDDTQDIIAWAKYLKAHPLPVVD